MLILVSSPVKVDERLTIRKTITLCDCRCFISFSFGELFIETTLKFSKRIFVEISVFTTGFFRFLGVNLYACGGCFSPLNGS